MKKVLLIALFAFISARSAEASYGAIAYSPSTGAVGTSWGYFTKSEAVDSALDFCFQPDCQITVWVNNACASLAVSSLSTYQYASAWSTDKEWAIDSALRQCGPNCYTKSWLCSY